jgi:23S rRNA pseudouridine2605 synthase
MIEQGRVMVNGQIVTKLGSKADPARDHIRVDGKLLQGAERHRYFVLNKPRGYVTTVSDPEGRPTVMEFFQKMGERLYPVGRLDYQSEGLLVMTNDGDLANRLTRAGSGVEKTYLVKVAGQPTENELEILRGGVAIERGKPGSPKVRTAPARILQIRQGDNPWYEVTLIEGRNRELRKIFSAIGHFVEKIRRVGYGPLILDLEPGNFRELEPQELAALRLTAEGKLKPKRMKTAGMLPSEAGRSVEPHGAKPPFASVRPPAPYRKTDGERPAAGRAPERFTAGSREGRESRPIARPSFAKPYRNQPAAKPSFARPFRGRPDEKPRFGKPQGARPNAGPRFGRPEGERPGPRPARFGQGAGPERPFRGQRPFFKPGPVPGPGSGPASGPAPGFVPGPAPRPPFNRPASGGRPRFDRPTRGGKPRFDRPVQGGKPRFDRPAREGKPRFEPSAPPSRPRRSDEFRPGQSPRKPFRPAGSRPAFQPSEPQAKRFGAAPGKNAHRAPAKTWNQPPVKTWNQPPADRPARTEGSSPAFRGKSRPGGFSKSGFKARPGGRSTGGFSKFGYKGKPGGQKRG